MSVNENYLNSANLPVHIGFIMDGNGRWAKARKLTRTHGHSAGVTAMEKIIRHCGDLGIRYVTFYAFSTENWSRPKAEVDFLMNLFSTYMDKIISDIKRGKMEAHFRFIGNLDVFSNSFREKIQYISEKTAENSSNITVNVAVNYGGRAEIVHAVNSFISENPNKIITEKDITERLYTGLLPDPDMIIRTAGESRLSNFLLWQGSYSEIYIASVCWPDFTPDELDKALEDYGRRTRKFGGLSE
ncbi:MAG: di-trans,poly-cis-decaprenylcistransferase [Ruminococcaceae bacterium]|nr:di-trans,poly-cis-decaprenylcistransferase [Oscillospiraceae bacterium]MBQ2915761.1 di-trans,poly-cis-decaprenylcistransferase [Clostridia bacterium]